MKIVGIYTKDFSLAHDIMNKMNERGIDYIHLHSIDRIPHKVGVIITSSAEGKDIGGRKVVYADCFRDIDSALDRAMQILYGNSDEIVIGIDPGEYPGIALLSGESVLRTWCASSTDEALGIVRKILNDFSDKERIVRIGHDARVYRDRIIDGLRDVDIKIEIVDETKTSQRTGYSRMERNEVAAIRIAKARGRLVRGNGDRKFTDGEIKEVQRKSRILSGGRITISRELALKVLKGEIEMEEAIKFSKSSN